MAKPSSPKGSGGSTEKAKPSISKSLTKPPSTKSPPAPIVTSVVAPVVTPIAADIIVQDVVPPPPKRKLYFINEQVEWLLTLYKWSGCTDVALRDAIMNNAVELIKQIIRKQGLHTIYPGHDDASFMDLMHVGWAQIERVLYKYKAKPHCRICFRLDRPDDSALYVPTDREYDIITIGRLFEIGVTKCQRCKTDLTASLTVAPEQDLYGGSETVLYRGISKVFNMWSQVARTVILAHIKKEGRDRKNSQSYSGHVGRRQQRSADISRFTTEAKRIFAGVDHAMMIIAAIEDLYYDDDRASDSLITKIIDRTKLPRPVVTQFFKACRILRDQFSDSPTELEARRPLQIRRQPAHQDDD